MNRKPRNEKRFREARRKAGLTGCIECKDKGKITRGIGAGAGRIGYRIETTVCYACLGDTSETPEDAKLTAALDALFPPGSE